MTVTLADSETMTDGLPEADILTVSASRDGPGKGPVFTVTPPMERATTDAAKSSPDTNDDRESGGRRMSIVLVDDNPDIRESMFELLTDLGHSVQAADNGGAGAELILRVSPDVAIVDLGLPVLDGYQVARRVRSQLGPSGIRLIALTGYGRESDRRKASEAGFDAHLAKPAGMEELIGVLSARD